MTDENDVTYPYLNPNIFEGNIVLAKRGLEPNPEAQEKVLKLLYELESRREGIAGTISVGYKELREVLPYVKHISERVFVCMFDEIFERWDSGHNKKPVVTDRRRMSYKNLGRPAYIGVVEGKLLTYGTKRLPITIEDAPSLSKMCSLVACTKDYGDRFGNLELARKLLQNFMEFAMGQDLAELKNYIDNDLKTDLKRIKRENLHQDILDFYEI
jgi:hypothetical protein